MEINFWEQRWIDNKIAFHQHIINPYLIDYLSNFQLQKQAVVFIPLCGKSLDIAWFAAQQHSVLGIECSEKAIKDFFKEQELDAKIEQSKTFTHYKTNNITLLHGDFFKLDPQDLKHVDIVYDRASLVALPEDLRQRYVNLLTQALPDKAEIFLVSLEYNQTAMSGPPFSVNHNGIIHLFEPDFSVNLLHECNIIESHLKFKERGLTYLLERIYKITRTTS
ncbi:Thiopurine S-methyltransferase [hydrothermal vent metagenome]|uniref:thiopurine S-methyltransferase n=1 Tax=hydrothermal vent metagenome TaxID=652676 RepID=A0A3B0WYF4_9ZZZZ